MTSHEKLRILCLNMKRDIAFNLQSVFLLLNCIICKAVMDFITAYLVFLYEQPWVTVHQHNISYYTAISETDEIHMMYRILFLCHSCCCVLPHIPKGILWQCLPTFNQSEPHHKCTATAALHGGGFTKDATLCTSIDALEKARKPQLILSHFSALSTLGP